MTSEYLVSLVVPLRNEASIIEAFVEDALRVLSTQCRHFELVLVDDRSTDDTLSVVSRLMQRHSAMRLIRLSRRFGVDIAITAGLEASIGDFVIVMSADSDPPGEIPRLLQLAKSRRDIDVILGEAMNRRPDRWTVHLLRTGFHFAAQRLLGLTLPRTTSTFCGLTRRAVNAMTRIKQKQRYVSLLCCSIGFGQLTFAYEKVYRSSVPKRRSLREAVDLGLAAVVASSTTPLRIVSYMGCLAALINLAYVGYVFLVNLIKSNVAEGWTTLSLQSSLMFFLNFVVLVVMSEYISHIQDESQDRPLYHIAEEEGSPTIVAGPGLRNVQELSVATDDTMTEDQRRAA